MLKWSETIFVWRYIGFVVVSGGPTHPVGVEGATMARRASFPPSSIPAYIEQSMKLFVFLSVFNYADYILPGCIVLIIFII